MSCFKKNRLIRSVHVQGSEGQRRMFVRLAGTVVEQQGDCAYIEGEDAIIIQWEGFPNYDSGYHARYFPATMAGLKLANITMDALK